MLNFCAIGAHTRLILNEKITFNTGCFIANESQTFKGHSDTVTCIAKGKHFVSGSHDKSIIVWNKNLRVNSSFGICCIETFQDFVVAGDVGRNLVVYKINENECQPIQSLKMAGFINCVKLIEIDGNLFMFIGGTDCRVHIYVLKQEFNLVLSLTGHTDWITDIDVIPFIGGYMVCSSCQDKTIRVWSITKTVEKEEQLQGLSTTKYALLDHVIFLDTVLVGHEGWVTSVSWIQDGLKNAKDLQLISTSIDCVMVWKLDGSTPIRLGNSRFSKAIGVVEKDSKKIYAASMGSIHEWEFIDGMWKQNVGWGGHTKPVTGISFDPTGSILVSVSGDQTARIYAPLKDGNWKEIARPQIHGYDINCLSFIDKYRYISGSDEKVLRVFEAPKSFVYSLANLTGSELDDVSDRVEGAQVPALGLSNKAIEGYSLPTGEEQVQLEAKIFTEPPLEEELQQTLWPETQKLYGHAYEIVSVASTAKLIASSSKATKVQDAVVRLWSIDSWTQIGACEFHSLTVTTTQFSHCGRYLLTSGRDRAWALFDTTQIVDGAVKLLASVRKAHARIVWGISWSHDDLMFATGSRDKTVKVWNTKGECLVTIPFEDSVTSVSFHHSKYILAVGLENGNIELVHLNDNIIESRTKLDEKDTHCKAVKQITWRKGHDQFASCSEDHSIRIFSI